MKKWTKFFIFCLSAIAMVGTAITGKPVIERTNAESNNLEVTITSFSEITTNYSTKYTHTYSVDDFNNGKTDIRIEAYGVYKNSNGIQMNSGKGTYIKNLDAFPGKITSIVCTWSASGKNSPTLYVSENTIASTSSTSLGKGSNAVTSQTYTVPSDGKNYKYFYFDGTTVTGACYVSMEINFESINTKSITYILGENGINDSRNPLFYEPGVGVPTLYNPTRNNYTFVEWQNNGEKVDSISPEESSDITLTAVWNENAKYSVKFNSNGGVLHCDDEILFYSGSKLTNISEPTKEGYQFVGWSIDGLSSISEEYIVTSDITLTALWKKCFTVSFVTNCDDALISITTYDGQTIDKPDNPTNDGFGLAGWFKESTFENEWDFDNDKVYADTTLYAKWVGKYSYTFSANAFDKAKNNFLLNGVEWTLTDNGKSYSYNNTIKAQQIGTASDPATSVTLLEGDLKGVISAVNVNAGGATSIQGSVSVKVGDKDFSCEDTKLPSNSLKMFEFSGSSMGDVKIIITQTSSRAIYLKSIEIVYDTNGFEELNSPTNISVYDGVLSFTGSGNADDKTTYRVQIIDSNKKVLKTVNDVNSGTNIFEDINKKDTYTVNVYAIANSSNCRFNGETPGTCSYSITAGYPEISVSSLLDKTDGANYYYQICGVISEIVDGKNLYINDTTGRIKCYGTNTTEYNVGESYCVSGYLSTYDDERELCSCSFTTPNEKVYIVAFNLNGGESLNEIPNQYIFDGSFAVSPNSDNLSKDNCEFVSWTYKGVDWDFDSDEVLENMELVAKWKENEIPLVTNSQLNIKYRYIEHDFVPATQVISGHDYIIKADEDLYMSGTSISTSMSQSSDINDSTILRIDLISDGIYSIKIGDNFLGGKTSGTDLQAGATINDNCFKWKISINDGKFRFTNVSQNSRSLGYQEEGEIFKNYSTSNATGYIYDFILMEMMGPRVTAIDTYSLRFSSELNSATYASKFEEDSGNWKCGFMVAQNAQMAMSFENAYIAKKDEITNFDEPYIQNIANLAMNEGNNAKISWYADTMDTLPEAVDGMYEYSVNVVIPDTNLDSVVSAVWFAYNTETHEIVFASQKDMSIMTIAEIYDDMKLTESQNAAVDYILALANN